jgi:hypothetical protein
MHGIAFCAVAVTRVKIARSHIGLKHTLETRKKIGLANRKASTPGLHQQDKVEFPCSRMYVYELHTQVTMLVPEQPLMPHGPFRGELIAERQRRYALWTLVRTRHVSFVPQQYA